MKSCQAKPFDTSGSISLLALPSSRHLFPPSHLLLSRTEGCFPCCIPPEARVGCPAVPSTAILAQSQCAEAPRREILHDPIDGLVENRRMGMMGRLLLSTPFACRDTSDTRSSSARMSAAGTVGLAWPERPSESLLRSISRDNSGWCLLEKDLRNQVKWSPGRFLAGALVSLSHPSHRVQLC